MNKAEKVYVGIKVIFFVLVLSIVLVTTCSAQNKNDLTRFSNDVALETGSILIHQEYDEQYDLHIAYLEPSIWNVKADMHNLSAMITEDYLNAEQFIAWNYTNSSELGPHYSALFRLNGGVYPDQIFMIMLVVDVEYIIVSTVNKDGMMSGTRSNL